MVARYRSAFSFWQFIAMLLFVIVLPSGERFEPFKSIYLVKVRLVGFVDRGSKKGLQSLFLS